MIDQYAVIGNPIQHSRSPEIHQAFARQTGEEISFVRLLAPENDFENVIRRFINEKGKGLSVTMPFKQQAFALSDVTSERASRAAAVNTLLIDDKGEIQGENTDGPGLVTDITENLDWRITNRRVLIVGAGGAARGILESICLESPSHVQIANRTESRAHRLAGQFAEMGHISSSSIHQLDEPFDLILNATGASLQGSNLHVPAAVIGRHTHCYDLAYAEQQTPFNRWCQDQGAVATADGLGMLVEQAALAFKLWRGTSPDTQPIISHIRNLMNKG
jgi:shikimate dehydrogenase